MKTIYINATKARKNFFEILDDVANSRSEFIIRKKGLSNSIHLKARRKNINLKKALDKSYGAFADFPDVTKDRVSRKKDIVI